MSLEKLAYFLKISASLNCFAIFQVYGPVQNASPSNASKLHEFIGKNE